jgi:copper homeostasis protein
LVALAAPLPVTFHRAIDMTPDPLEALEAVIASGAQRILTSGGKPNALRGAHEIARMVERAQGRIAIMPGCGVTAQNIAEIALITGAHEFHSSVRTPLESPVQYRKRGVAMGDVRASEYQRYEVRDENVRELVNVLENLAAEPVSASAC